MDERSAHRLVALRREIVADAAQAEAAQAERIAASNAYFASRGMKVRILAHVPLTERDKARIGRGT